MDIVYTLLFVIVTIILYLVIDPKESKERIEEFAWWLNFNYHYDNVEKRFYKKLFNGDKWKVVHQEWYTIDDLHTLYKILTEFD